MHKVTFDYSPEIARKKLSSRFNSTLDIQSTIADMCDSQLTVFAALCDGKTVTSAGNRVNADYEVTRLSSVIDVLENKFFLPIERQKVSTETDTGGNAKQAIYHIEMDDIALMETDFERLKRERQKAVFLKAESRDVRYLKRLISERGIENAKSLFSLVSDA